MLITFSGLDGAGKSTVIDILRTALEARQTPVVVRHMNHDIGMYAAAQALRDRILGRTPSRGHSLSRGADRDHRPAAEARTPIGDTWWLRLRYAILWNKPCRRLIYLVDLLIFLAFRFYVERLSQSVLIMDRYFYDTLVDVAGPHSWAWARLLERLTPTPSLAVFLDTRPEVAFARKGEHSIDYLAQRSSAYQRVFGWVRSAVVIDNTDPVRTAGELALLVGERRQ
jgi:thymidylate kinase